MGSKAVVDAPAVTSAGAALRATWRTCSSSGSDGVPCSAPSSRSTRVDRSEQSTASIARSSAPLSHADAMRPSSSAGRRGQREGGAPRSRRDCSCCWDVRLRVTLAAMLQPDGRVVGRHEVGDDEAVHLIEMNECQLHRLGDTRDVSETSSLSFPFRFLTGQKGLRHVGKKVRSFSPLARVVASCRDAAAMASAASSRTQLVLQLAVFLDLLGVMLVVPNLIHRFRELGISTANYGVVSSVYSASQARPPTRPHAATHTRPHTVTHAHTWERMGTARRHAVTAGGVQPQPATSARRLRSWAAWPSADPTPTHDPDPDPTPPNPNQIVGGLAIGYLGDNVLGRKRVLLLSFAGATP